jgi:hypothetical protein
MGVFLDIKSGIVHRFGQIVFPEKALTHTEKNSFYDLAGAMNKS